MVGFDFINEHDAGHIKHKFPLHFLLHSEH